MNLDRIGKISTSSIFDSESPRRNSYSQSSPDNIFLVKYVMSQSPAISQPDLGLVSQKYFRLENIDQKIFSQTNKINATDHPTKREREKERVRYVLLLQCYLFTLQWILLCVFSYHAVFWVSVQIIRLDRGRSDVLCFCFIISSPSDWKISRKKYFSKENISTFKHNNRFQPKSSN